MTDIKDETPYTKRELDTKFKSLEEKNDSWFASVMEKIQETHTEQTKAFDDMREHEIKPILIQTKLTNGRVTTLEKRADGTDKWRSWLTGAAFVLVPIFVTVSSWLILQQLGKGPTSVIQTIK